MAKRLCTRLASDVIASLDKSYDLIYVDYRDKLTDDQAAMVVRGDIEALWESTDEWVSDQRHATVTQIITQAVADMVRTWEAADEVDYSDLIEELPGGDEWERIVDAVHERDDSDYARTLIRQTERQLLRINVIDEDHGYSFQQVDPLDVLARVGLPATERNVRVMAETLNECSPEHSVLMGHWIVGADLEQLYDLPDDCAEVTITNPHLYLGNPFAGSGFISEEAFEGVVYVPRERLLTDKAAFGASVDAMYGGLSASDYACEIAPSTTPAQAPAAA